jgi:two-component system C4-dicarboxylate transport sensor histidine kinase DctB
VVLEVEDSGPGINEEAFPRLFEPFFTSRPEGKGTGLGLHIARSAARECGGDIVAANRPEGGAVFRVFLPPA